MTTIKITGMSTHASTALEPHIQGIYDDQRATRLIVAELEHVSRTEPGPASNAVRQVSARLSRLEVPSGINQDLFRIMMRSLYLLRTGRGTLDEASGELNLATESAKIADGIGVLFATEAAEARSVLHALLDQLDALGSITDETKRRRRVKKLVDAGRAFLGTGDRETLAALAQDPLDFTGAAEGTSPVEVDVTASDNGAGGPVRVGDVVPDVVPAPPAKAPRKRAARKPVDTVEQQPATTGAGA